MLAAMSQGRVEARMTLFAHQIALLLLERVACTRYSKYQRTHTLAGDFTLKLIGESSPPYFQFCISFWIQARVRTKLCQETRNRANRSPPLVCRSSRSQNRDNRNDSRLGLVAFRFRSMHTIACACRRRTIIVPPRSPPYAC